MAVPSTYPILTQIGDILLDVFDDRYSVYPPIFTQYTNTPPGERTPESVIGLMGFDELQSIAFGAPTPMQDMEEVYRTDVDISKRARGFTVDEMAVKLDRSGKLKRAAERLARSAQHSKETIGASLINNMITTNHATRAVPLASNSQPLGGGGTFDNRIDGDLSVASFDSAMIQFRNFVDERNLKINITPRFLVHTPNDERVAKQLLGSEREPFTADNQMNVFRDYGVRPLLNPWITDTDNAALIAAPEDNGLYVVMWQDVRRRAWVDEDADALKFKVTLHCTAAFADFRGFVGIVGAA